MAPITNSCIALAVLVCAFCVALVSSAPSRRGQADSDGTKLSIILNKLADDTALTDPEFAMPARSRSKRHAALNEDALDELAIIDSDTSLSPRQRRDRRSAVLLLHTSLRFCNNYPNFCRRVEIDEGDVRVKVRLEDE